MTQVISLSWGIKLCVLIYEKHMILSIMYNVYYKHK